MQKHRRPFFTRSVCALSLLFSADCTLSARDLRYSQPKTPIIKICDRPLDVADDLNLWGYDFLTKRLITAEDPAELRMFDSADLFFEYDPDAPVSSLQWAPTEWGLTCAMPPTFLADESEFLPRKEPCLAEGRPNPRFLGQTTGGKPRCDPPGQGKKKAPKRVHVCVRPPSVGDVSEWGIFLEGTGNRWTSSAPDYTHKVATADIIFVFDENARPESAYYFVKDPKDPEGLRCKDKPPPKPYDEVVGSGDLPMLADVTAARAAQGNPKKGDGKTTETSGPNGKGPPLDFLESLSRNLSIAGALASGDTSGDLKDPNGSRYGIPGGKNVGGPNLQILQAAAGTFAIIRSPFKTGKEFIETVRTALTGRKVAGILDPKVLSKEIAEQLAKEPEKKELQAALDALKKGDTKPLEALESFGKAMAVSLREAGVILPYSRAEIFTKGWGGKFQAHHALEVAMAKETLNMDDKAIANIPAIILTEAEHIEMTNSLNKARDAVLAGTRRAIPDKQELWKIYQEAYKDRPAWLEAIKGYFPNVP